MTKGMKTSEFWIAGMTPMLIMILNHMMGWGLTAEMIGAGSIGPVSYAISRGMAK